MRTYSYRLRAPTLGADIVAAQMRDAHRYYNALIEIEHERRAAWQAAMSAHADVECHEAWVSVCSEQRDAARDAIRRVRKAARRRADTAEQRELVRELSVTLKDVRGLLRAAKVRQRKDVNQRKAEATIKAAAKTRRRAARAECGCFWGTYLIVEQAAEAACKAVKAPRFHRWDGSGAIAVQLQRGLGLAQLASDRRLQIDMPPAEAWDRRRDPRTRTVVRLRVGSMSKAGARSKSKAQARSKGRTPVWAAWPLIMHRSLPDGARIMWARITRKRVEARDHWMLHLSVDEQRVAPRPVAAPAAEAVAVDLGWRARPNGRLRIAYLWDGLKGREVLLDSGVQLGLRKVDDLRSIRDKHLAVACRFLLEWLRGRESVPDWLREATQYLHQWRAQARLAGLTLRWRSQRFAGDDIFAGLEAWRKRDKHLWTWEVNLRRQVLTRRREQYRVLAVELAQRYGALVLELFDLRRVQRHVATESEEVDVQMAHSQQQIAAPSELRDCFVQAFATRRRIVARMPAVNSTRECGVDLPDGSRCRSLERWDQAAELEHRCSTCGTLWDQDANACRVLLARWRERSGAVKDLGSARVRDYSEVEPPKPGRFAKWRQQNEAARNAEANDVEL